jgi:hypothetical protein
MWIYDYLVFFLEWEMFQTKFVENIKTRLYAQDFFKSRHLWANVQKFCTAGHATVVNMAQLDT